MRELIFHTLFLQGQLGLLQPTQEFHNFSGTLGSDNTSSPFWLGLGVERTQLGTTLFLFPTPLQGVFLFIFSSYCKVSVLYPLLTLLSDLR